MKASDNAYPSILTVEQGSTPASPSSGQDRLFVRSSDHLLCMVNSSGTVTAIGSFVNPMTTAGDLIIGGSSGTPTRLAAGTNTYVLTMVSGSPAWAAGGGGGITQAYVGYNTAGASTETAAVNQQRWATKVTLANACLVTSIGAYIKGAAAGTYFAGAVALYTDSSGPAVCLSGTGAQTLFTNTTAGWIDWPLGVWVASGTYWLIIQTAKVGATQLPVIAYDTGGSDLHNTSGATDDEWENSPTFAAATSNKYSIRANTIR